MAASYHKHLHGGERASSGDSAGAKHIREGAISVPDVDRDGHVEALSRLVNRVVFWGRQQPVNANGRHEDGACAVLHDPFQLLHCLVRGLNRKEGRPPQATVALARRVRHPAIPASVER